MAGVICKEGVRFQAFTPGLLRILYGVYRCAHGCSDVKAVVITSANDSTHAKDSRHYRDEALDLRVHNFLDDAAVLRFAKALRVELGPAFTVLWESAGTPNSHLHLQPKRGTAYAFGDLERDLRREAA